MKNKVKVAILDTGIDTQHDYLKDNIVGGISFILTKDDYIVTSEDYEDYNGHGTACASIIKKELNDVELFIVKVLDEYGRTNIQVLEEALKELINKDIRIINLSLSVMKSEMVKDLYKICEELTNKGKIIVCSLANGFEESYPAVFDNVIGVKGFILEDKNCFWYNRNRKIQCIIDNNPYLNCNINNSYKLFGKCNSQAAAKITGKIAKILSDEPSISLDDLHDKLEILSNKIIWDDSEFITSKRHPDFKERLYKRDNSTLVQIVNILKEVLIIDKDNESLFNCSLFNKHIGLTYDKCFEVIKKLEEKFNIKFEYINISRYDLVSIYTLTELVEKKLQEREGI